MKDSSRGLLLHRLFSLSAKVFRCRDLSERLQDPVFLSRAYTLPKMHSFLGLGDEDFRLGWNESGLAFELISENDFSLFGGLSLFLDFQDDKESHELSSSCFIFSFEPQDAVLRVLNARQVYPKESSSVPSRFGAIRFSFSEEGKKRYAVRGWLHAELFLCYDPHARPGFGFSFSYSWDEEGKLVSFSGGVESCEWDPACWQSLQVGYLL
ncbi:hypothetical protein [Candidatus Similichlamydia laticola]|uniref:Uncharacterized protein n=1 Tax=Candidatus Similichlamydia laticola TaxID=2170265 RepID=A0A369KF80_9BACT|nr:hypothetical protein [Candidatus Similichlamydia laticola]RDB31355.1 hypothetical protein HAT2_00540 [Candidatus Similichlamydia laticola]